jgi:hypothetical protein
MSDFNALRWVFLPPIRPPPHAAVDSSPARAAPRGEIRGRRALKLADDVGGFGRVGHQGLGFNGDLGIIADISEEGKLFLYFPISRSRR